MYLAVVGTGYVGLVAAACFADSGNNVIGVDADAHKIAQLQQGRSPIYEPGLEELLERNIREGRLRFTTDLAGAVRNSEIIFIAVGTPSHPYGSVDLSQVLTAAEEIARSMNSPKIIVLKSTVPVGTAAQVQALIARYTRYEFEIVSNPEFLKEGAALNDFLKQENIASLLDNPRFHFLQHDVTESLSFTDSLDYVLHLASPASPTDYLRYPIETLRTGALGTYHMLELARQKGAVFMLASTSEVYGDPEVNPQPEGYWGHVNPIGPRSCYDEAKRYAEALTMACHRRYELNVKIARIFNTYGPLMRPDDGRVVSNFCWQALHNKPLTIYGDGTQTRSFCYIDDMIEGLYRLLLSDETGPINIGNPDEVSILTLAKESIELADSQSQIVFKPLPVDDPKVRRPDIRLAKELLSWEPKVSRREGLLHTLDYFRSLIVGMHHENRSPY